MKNGVNVMTVVKSPKGSVRSFLLNELANGVELPAILLSLNEKGLKPGNAKLHLKKAMAQFKSGGISAVNKEKKTSTRENKEAMQAELDAIVKESDEYVASLQSDFMRRMVYAD